MVGKLKNCLLWRMPPEDDLIFKEFSSNVAQLEICESLAPFLKEATFRCTTGFVILHANQALVKMLGFANYADVAGKQMQEFYAEEELKMFLVDKLKSDGLIVDYSILLRRRDGTNFWSLLTCKKVIRKGVEVVEGVVRDISDHVTLEQHRKNDQIQLEKIRTELDRFVYSASHDIRAPISSTMGIVNIMKHEFKDALTTKYVLMMEECISKLDNFVTELAKFAQNTRKIVENRNIDFKVMIEDIVQQLGNAHPSFQQIEVTLRVQTTAVFYSDRDRVRLIIHNVIKNAFDYCDIKKSWKTIDINIATEDANATIEVFDNGIGIPARYVDHVFEMFYRGTNTSKGSGMGLYIAREAATRLGATIALESEYGVGTSVKIIIPNSTKGKLINRKKVLRTSP